MMYPISEDDYYKYYQNSQGFDWVAVPECGVVLIFRSDSKELVAIDDGDKYYAKYLYWIV